VSSIGDNGTNANNAIDFDSLAQPYKVVRGARVQCEHAVYFISAAISSTARRITQMLSSIKANQLNVN